MAINLVFEINGAFTNTILDTNSLSAIPLVGDLYTTGSAPNYKIVSRRFQFGPASKPGQVVVLFQVEEAPDTKWVEIPETLPDYTPIACQPFHK